jgi:ATP-dependent RNA helicase RhlE
MPFSKLGLSPRVLAGVTASGYTEPTAIQLRAIPLIMSGRDLVGSAQTGTGKTAAFALPILSRLAQRGALRALVLEPTRELAAQVETAVRDYGRFTDLRPVVLFGGTGYGRQDQALRRGADIVVATPGRLLDQMGRGLVRLNQIEILVLDEADRMLDMGFKPQLDRILGSLPPRRQTLLFSATMADEVGKLAHKQTKNPVRVAVGPQAVPPSRAVQDVYLVESHQKRPLLLSLLGQDDGNILVFARTKHRTDRLVHSVRQAGHAVQRLHSDRSQSQRREALEGFRNGRYRILVATDIAARGIDVAGIRRVINFDLPQTVEDYVHRVGRTARAEADGHASSFAAPEERGQLRAIERHIGRSLPRQRHDAAQTMPNRLTEVQYDQERRSPPIRPRGLGDRDRHWRERQSGIVVGNRRRVSRALS